MAMSKWDKTAHREGLRLALDTLQGGAPASEIQGLLEKARKHLEALEATGEDWGSWRMWYDRLRQELED